MDADSYVESEHGDVAAHRPRVEIDWHEVARVAFRSALFAGIVGGALHALGKAIEANAADDVHDVGDGRNADPSAALDDGVTEDEDVAPDGDVDDEDVRAAALLGVPVDASEDEIRGALRARLAVSQLHPDHGGDGEEAKELIAAKNLLVERARAARS